MGTQSTKNRRFSLFSLSGLLRLGAEFLEFLEERRKLQEEPDPLPKDNEHDDQKEHGDPIPLNESVFGGNVVLIVMPYKQAALTIEDLLRK